jgi:hypothetical protein
MAFLFSALLAVVLMLTLTHYSQRRETDVLPTTNRHSLTGKKASRAPVGPANLSPSTVAQKGAAPPTQATAVGQPQRVDRETVIRCLKAWIHKREGQDVKVVSTQDILDFSGKPAGMNVVVTTKLDNGLTEEELKHRISAITAHERDLNEQLYNAKQHEDIATVNRVAAEIAENRTQFVTDSGVISYRVSVSTEQPPVLAYWHGLPFEMVREEAVQSLAEVKLGTKAQFANLVQYTSQAALLHFSNDAGTDVYIDPVNMREFPPEKLQTAASSKPQRADPGRQERVRVQWADFLNP